MRTKTLLLTAAIGVAGIASSMAQAVYSVNAVGYHNVTVATRAFSIIANQLRATDSRLPAIIPTAPLGSTVYKFAGGTYTISTFDEDDFGNQAWTNPSMTLVPGEGAWFRNAGASAFTMTFVGEVPEGSLSHSVPAGFSLQSSEVPQSAGITSVLNYQPGLGDTVYFYSSTSGYTIYTFDEDDFGNRVWLPSEPVPAVGQGFWIKNNGATKNWTRSFDITP
jgi:hypothetical protein